MSETPENAASPSGSMPNAKVLIVSRDQLFARIMRMKLETWGLVARHEDAPTPAMEWFRLDLFRLLVVDLDLPDGQGLDLVREIRNFPRPGYTYVIGYSSSSDKDLLMTALEAGIDYFALKPFHPGELRLRLLHATRTLQMDDLLFAGGGTDPATGVINKTAFERFFGVLLAQANRSQHGGVLMFVSVQQQQALFRKFGFQGVHDVDIEIASVLDRALFRQSDLLAKIGNGDFCLLLHGTDLERSRIVRQRLIEAFADFKVTVDGTEFQPRLGVCELAYPEAGKNVSDYLDPDARQDCEVLLAGQVPDDADRPLKGHSGLI